jgi:hypothetical protein
MPLTQLSVDDGPNNSDGLLLHGRGETTLACYRLLNWSTWGYSEIS